MQDEVPGPPPDWVHGEEWNQDADAIAERSKWPDPEALKGTKDENTLQLLRHSPFRKGYPHHPPPKNTSDPDHP
jgi:hypothetical protein